MMTVSDLLAKLGGKLVCEGDRERRVDGCYISDLLSDVLASSNQDQVWLTHHTHANIVAVAAVKDLSAIVIVDGRKLDEDAASRAKAEKVNVISTELSTFEAAGLIFTAMKG